MNNKWELEGWVREFALLPVRYFYPTLPARTLGLDLDDVTKWLLELVGEEQLELLWEARCPECLEATIPSESMPTEYECRCGEVIAVDETNLVPVFRVSPKYKEYIAKKNNQIRQRHRLFPRDHQQLLGAQ